MHDEIFEKKSLYDFSQYRVEKSETYPKAKIPEFFTDKNPIPLISEKVW